ncbi:MAG: SDR family oxidoreductase [Deltaproteobacteria bacterium]|nr:SDR family oxidoreductase [Deltaproteobacteria bacterium]
MAALDSLASALRPRSDESRPDLKEPKMIEERFGMDARDAIVVTGAASGIGRATALLAGRLGLGVAAWDLDPAGVEEAVAEIVAAGGRGLALEVDVTDDARVSAAFVETSKALGIPRYLVNNAGPRSTSDLDFQDGLRIAAGSMQMVTAKWMTLELPEPAAVVNVASVAGNLVGTSPDWYGSSKAAIAGYTRYLAITQARRLRANAVAPGAVDTPRLAPYLSTDAGRRWQETNPMGRIGRPEDVAPVICFLLSPAAGYVNGALVPIDGGATLIL